MLTLFQVCFFVGIGLTIITVLSGCFFHFTGIEGLDLDFISADVVIPTNPIVYILFLTVFGGVGIIFLQAENPLHMYIILPVAAVSGVVMSYLVNRFVIKPLKRAQNTSAADEAELIGLLAEVTEKIYENGFGEIRYVIHDNSYTAPAKSMNGEGIEKGTEVVICIIEKHIFYVTKYE